jgi:hypothetical protein
VAWGLRRISSRELTEWVALVKVEHEDEKRRQDQLESGDGQVFVSGLDEDDDEDLDDGEPVSADDHDSGDA